MYISFTLAGLAQRLEHRICNAMVIGSNPITGFSQFVFYTIDNIFFINKKLGEFDLCGRNQEMNLLFGILLYTINSDIDQIHLILLCTIKL